MKKLATLESLARDIKSLQDKIARQRAVIDDLEFLRRQNGRGEWLRPEEDPPPVGVAVQTYGDDGFGHATWDGEHWCAERVGGIVIPSDVIRYWQAYKKES